MREGEIVELDAALVALALLAEGDAVGVAHAHRGDEPCLAVDLHLGADRGAVLGGVEGARDLGRVENGLAHVDAHLAVGTNLGLDEAREGANLVRLGFGAVHLGDEISEAPDAVAAHLGLGAVGVVHAHGVVLVGLHEAGGHREDDAVGADAKVAIAQLRAALGGELDLRAVPVVHEHEIVAEALVLVELDGIGGGGDRDGRAGTRATTGDDAIGGAAKSADGCGREERGGGGHVYRGGVTTAGDVRERVRWMRGAVRSSGCARRSERRSVRRALSCQETPPTSTARNWTHRFFRDASRGFSQTTTTRAWPRKSPRSRSMRASPRSSSLTCPISAIGSRSRAFPRFGGQRLGHLAAGGSTTTRSWSKELSRRGCPTNYLLQT